MLLGEGPCPAPKTYRKITEIEQSVLDGVFRILLQDLKMAWPFVTPLEFTIESHETEWHLLRIHAPNEAMVAVTSGLAP
jgi:flagellar motor switch protein FliM